MATPMSEEQLRAFLQEGTRTGKLATTRADGRPHVAPIWFVVDESDGSIVFNTGAESVKGRTIARDPRIALCVDDDRPPYSFAVIEGIAEVSDDVDALVAWATRIAARYMGEDKAEEYGRRNGVPGELLVRLRPMRITALAAISE